MASNYSYNFERLGRVLGQAEHDHPTPRSRANLNRAAKEVPLHPIVESGVQSGEHAGKHDFGGTCNARFDGRSLVNFNSLSMWWWWEITAAAVSMASLVLLVALLKNLDGKTYSDWTYRISPNAILAVIMTVGKASLLFLFSNCLRQLKWNQFHIRRRLHNLHTIDQASREFFWCNRDPLQSCSRYCKHWCDGHYPFGCHRPLYSNSCFPHTRGPRFKWGQLTSRKHKFIFQHGRLDYKRVACSMIRTC
jgi:hypothetical protein